MAWRIHETVVRGEIDNRQPGTVHGRVWFLGRLEPVELRLTGNCAQDLAGCRLEFTNPTPATTKHPLDRFAALQDGIVGDITAARKVRVLDVSSEQAGELARAHQPIPCHLGNCLYLEWFSQANGRVVIESADYQLTVSEPAWRLSADDHQQQLAANADAMRQWLERLGEIRPLAETPSDPGEDEDTDDEDPGRMDEFQWEKEFRESDARTDKYIALQEKYEGHPDAERLIAREMGWDWVEEVLDAEKKGALPPSPSPADDDLPELVPNPLTEGVDWVRDQDGDVCHPLQHRAFESTMALWHYCQDHGLLEDNGDGDLHEMLFQAQTATAKMAGALHGLAYDDHLRDPGFIVAALKRALSFLHLSLGAAEKLTAKTVLDPDRLAAFRQELFEVRAGILALMDRFRKEA